MKPIYQSEKTNLLENRQTLQNKPSPTVSLAFQTTNNNAMKNARSPPNHTGIHALPTATGHPDQPSIIGSGLIGVRPTPASTAASQSSLVSGPSCPSFPSLHPEWVCATESQPITDPRAAPSPPPQQVTASPSGTLAVIPPR